MTQIDTQKRMEQVFLSYLHFLDLANSRRDWDLSPKKHKIEDRNRKKSINFFLLVSSLYKFKRHNIKKCS